MLYLPIGVIILRFCKILDSTFFSGLWTPHFFVLTPQFGWNPRFILWYRTKLSCLAFLANTLSTSSGVGQYCDSVCLRLRPMAPTQLHFPISSRPIVGIGLTDFYPKKFLMGVKLTQGSHMSEPRSGWSSRPEWLIAGSGVFGEGAASSPLPPAREECCKLSSWVIVDVQ